MSALHNGILSKCARWFRRMGSNANREEAAKILQDRGVFYHVTHDEMAFSEVISSDL